MKYKYNMTQMESLFDKLRSMEKDFLDKYSVDDIYSNSKIYEVLIANHFNHSLIPGHSGSRDAKDKDGNEIEYKHYKESSSNHSWTFNDFSTTSIAKISLCPYVYFVYIDDVKYTYPGQISWAYIVSGKKIARYLSTAVKTIKNKRKMINISPTQLDKIDCSRILYKPFDIAKGVYGEDLNEIITTVQQLENISGVTGLLTSNKLWELMVGIKLHHFVNSEQGGRKGAHDAIDEKGLKYEYKVSKSYSWQFQDISENVLEKYLQDHAIILAVVNKTYLKLDAIYTADPKIAVPVIREKLEEKKKRYSIKGKEIRRLQISLCKGDLIKIKAKKIL